MERNEDIEIERILDIVKRKKILIIFILIIFMVLGYFYSYYCVTPKYKATSTMLLIPDSTYEKITVTNSDLTLNSGLIDTYSTIAKNAKILKQVIQNLGLKMTEEELSKQIQVNAVKDTYVIEIAISNTNPQIAMDITKELVNVFLEEIKQIYNLKNVEIVDEAQLPEQPYNINHSRDMAIFFVIGLITSGICIMMIYVFDSTIKKEEDIEKYIEIKTLGNIPINANKKQEIIERNTLKSYVTECINTIRTNILYMTSTNKGKTVLITSCTPREGKSWVSANLAVSFAGTNKKVLLIDADMRKGRAHKIFKVNNKEGLSNYLYSMTGDIDKDIKLGKQFIKETKIPNLHILTNGTIPPNPSELIGSNDMKELIKIVKNIYDIVIIDAPPCKLVTDSVLLSTIVDSTVLVANAEKTKIKDLNEVRKAIQTVGGQVIGAILNKTQITGKTYSKNYYGHVEEKEETKKKTKKKIISVDEVIKEGLSKSKQNSFSTLLNEEEKLTKIEENKDIVSNKEKDDINYEAMKEFMKEQNNYIHQIINMVLDIKIELNHDKMREKVENRKSKNELENWINTKIKELEIPDYTNQFAEINEMLVNLKDSYLELTNKVRLNELETEKINNKNIIDFKLFKKQRDEKKKKAFSIEDDISYYELEKVATYVIPMPKREENISLFEDYKKIMW